MSTALLEIRDLRVSFGSAPFERRAVQDVSFAVQKREAVALVGESGSGKSLTALAILRLTPSGSQISSGAIRLGDTDLASLGDDRMRDIRGRRIGIVFQNPMSALNPVFTVGHQITEVLKRHQGLRRRDARDRAVELLKLVQLSDPTRRVDQYPHQLSGGMRQRAMIAIALSAGPEMLIADEPTTALDVTVQAQILDLLGHLQDELGMAMILISHDLAVVAGVVNEINVMYAGRIVEHADTRTLFRAPAHPYTQALLRAVRDLGSAETVDLKPIPGAPPKMGNSFAGCSFAPRCPLVVDKCRVKTPALRTIRPNQEAACHLAGA